MITSRSVVLVAVGAVLGLVIGGSTVVYAASTSKAVKVCVTKHNVVRAANSSGKCPKKTTKKSVSLQGPTGPAGAAGPTGPSDAWSINTAGKPNGATPPAGSYVVTGYVHINGPTGSCTLWHSTGPSSSAGKITYAQGTTYSSVPIGESFTLGAGSFVWVDCSGGSSSPNIAVTKVGALH